MERDANLTRSVIPIDIRSYQFHNTVESIGVETDDDLVYTGPMTLINVNFLLENLEEAEVAIQPVKQLEDKSQGGGGQPVLQINVPTT